MTEMRSRDLIAALDEASLRRFHLRAVLVSGMGFFTDAYDLFVIGIASTLVARQWHLSSGRLALLNSVMLAAAFLGAFVFGRFADVAGRKRVYWMVAAIMIVGALGSALSPSFWMLIVFRFVLGFGVGGDYPVSAVMMIEYANRKDRGKLVGMVFGTQALGLIVGPLVALALLGGGASNDVTWRVLLGLGAVPAAAVLYLRLLMPESPRYQVQVQGRAEQAASQIAAFTGGRVGGDGSAGPRQELGLRAFLTDRRWLVMLAGTAGTWFLLDYAHCWNTISTPQILGLISPHASTTTKIALQLAIFAVAAVPGYVLAIAWLDRIGHRRLQWTGFAVMAACFLVIAAVPGMTTTVAPFLLVYGVSYFFTEFGPNMTTFVMPSELYPVAMRATGHGISAGIGKDRLPHRRRAHRRRRDAADPGLPSPRVRHRPAHHRRGRDPRGRGRHPACRRRLGHRPRAPHLPPVQQRAGEVAGRALAACPGPARRADRARAGHLPVRHQPVRRQRLPPHRRRHRAGRAGKPAAVDGSRRRGHRRRRLHRGGGPHPRHRTPPQTTHPPRRQQRPRPGTRAARPIRHQRRPRPRRPLRHPRRGTRGLPRRTRGYRRVNGAHVAAAGSSRDYPAEGSGNEGPARRERAGKPR
jgi:MFS transporter, PHS family, inorganic phosphate transporter